MTTSSIADLRSLANSLNQATGELNKFLEKTEEELRELNLGVIAWSSTPLASEGYLNDTYLGWDIISIRGTYKWALAIKKKETFESKYLLEQGRETRAAAAVNLEPLFAALHIEAEKTLKAVTEGLNAKLGGYHA